LFKITKVFIIINLPVPLMPMNRQNYFYLIIGVAIAAMFGLYFLKQKEDKPIYRLSYFGPDSATSKSHLILPFSFSNQDNKSITLDNMKGRITVIDFFFTTCHTICPIMSNNLMKVDSTFKNSKEIYILSHTVDPETDSVPILKVYAQQHDASKNWDFVTGDIKALYQQALKSYLIATPQEVTGAEDDFVHSQNLVLVDDELHIRGFYDGTSPKSIDLLISDIKILMDEKHYRNKLK
jgi:protein SCO1